MLVPSSVMISAPATSRLRMDSAMTASGMDLYHSSGVNWDVTMVDPRGFALCESIEQLVCGSGIDWGGEEIIED